MKKFVSLLFIPIFLAISCSSGSSLLIFGHYIKLDKNLQANAELAQNDCRIQYGQDESRYRKYLREEAPTGHSFTYNKCMVGKGFFWVPDLQ